MKKIIGLFLSCISLGAIAQPTVFLNKFYGNAGGAGGQSFVKTTDGGYFILGTIHGNGGNVTDYKGGVSDMWAIKLDASYAVTWQKCLGGSDADLASGNGTGGSSVQQTADGGYVVVGVTKSVDGDITVNYGDYDAFVVKLSPTGNIQWARTYGGAGEELDFKIKQTTDGGYLLAGTTQSSNSGDVDVSHGNRDAWIVKLNTTGDIQWQKCIGSTNQELFGNFILTADGGYMLAMSSRGSDGDVSGNHQVNRYDYWIAKMDNTGTIAWQKCYGGTDEDYVLGICEAPGGFVLAGYTYSGDGDVPSNNGDADCWFLRIDNAGTILWKRAYGGMLADIAYGIEPTMDGGFIAVCTAETLGGDLGDIVSSYGEHDGWLLKLSNSGALEWQKCVGGALNDWGMQIVELSANNYLMLGQANSNDGSVSGNPWARSVWLTLVNASGTLPIYFLQLNARSNGDDALLNWSIPNNNECKQFIVERSVDGTSFSPVAIVNCLDNISSYKYTDQGALAAATLLYYRVVGVGINDRRDYSNVVRVSRERSLLLTSIIGNPVSDRLAIRHESQEPRQLVISVYDVAGRQVLSSSITVQSGLNRIYLPVNNLTAGLFHVQLRKPGNTQPVFVGKFIKKGR